MFPALLPLLLLPACLLPLLLLQLQRQRVQQEHNAEEEDKTNYSEEDLMQDWEFKIIRNPRNEFDRRAYLDQVLQEEAKAGWQLVEKFDGMRVRLKRPVSQRAGDATLPADYDPYRTAIGSKGPFHLPISLCWIVFASCALLLGVVPFIQSKDPISPEAFRTLMWVFAAGAILFGPLALGLTLRARRVKKRV